VPKLDAPTCCGHRLASCRRLSTAELYGRCQLGQFAYGPQQVGRVELRHDRARGRARVIAIVPPRVNIEICCFTRSERSRRVLRYSVHDQVAVITGGVGIGRLWLSKLLEAGYQVALAGRREDKLRETAALSSGTSLVVPTDVTDADSVHACSRGYGPNSAASTCCSTTRA